MADVTLTVQSTTHVLACEGAGDFYPRMTVDACLTVVIQREHFGVTQYQGFDFNSFCHFNGKVLAANKNGIVVLDEDDNDAGFNIEAFIELPMTDFGLPNQKRIRKAFLGYETAGELSLTVKADEEAAGRTYTVKAIQGDSRQHGGGVSVGRDGKGRYWSFRVDNVDGCDFSIDSLDAAFVIIGKTPKGWKA